jgi:hypothetical protein
MAVWLVPLSTLALYTVVPLKNDGLYIYSTCYNPTYPRKCIHLPPYTCSSRKLQPCTHAVTETTGKLIFPNKPHHICWYNLCQSNLYTNQGQSHGGFNPIHRNYMGGRGFLCSIAVFSFVSLSKSSTLPIPVSQHRQKHCLPLLSSSFLSERIWKMVTARFCSLSISSLCSWKRQHWERRGWTIFQNLNFFLSRRKRKK